MDGDPQGDCPVCDQKISQDKLEAHVNICLFLRESGDAAKSSSSPANKRKNFSIFEGGRNNQSKRMRRDESSNGSTVIDCDSEEESSGDKEDVKKNVISKKKNKLDGEIPSSSSSNIPLAERMRPETLDNYIGQTHILSKNTVLRQVLDKNEIPSMIFWGPSGCGKVRI